MIASAGIAARLWNGSGKPPSLPLRAAGFTYGLGARLHRWLYERGILARRALPCVVVSVGNLTVGGSGKTPLAARVAETLRDAGHAVALLSRGYGRRAGAPVEVVSDGDHVRSAPQRSGDEPWLLAGKLPGVPVVVGANRAAAGYRAHAVFGSDVVVLDDGLQHHRLRRDVDLVAVDARAGLSAGRLLPAGRLREPPDVLARADALVIVDGALRDEDAALVNEHAPGAPRFAARRTPVGLRSLSDRSPHPLGALAGREVGLLSAIAGPAGFRSVVEELGAVVCAERVFRDHHHYRPRDLEGLEAQAPLWITTEKDAVKLLPTWAGAAEVLVLEIELRFAEPEAFRSWLCEAVSGAREARRRARGRAGRGV